MKATPVAWASRPCAGVSVCIVALILLLLPINIARADPSKAVRDRLNQADAARNAKDIDGAAAQFKAIATDAKVDNDSRLLAYSRLVDIQRQQKKYDDAVASMTAMIELPNADEARQARMFDLAELYASAGHTQQAVKELADAAARYPDDDELAITTDLRAAAYLARDKQPAQAADYYASALKRMDPDDDRVPDALWNQSLAYWGGNLFDKALDPARKLSDPRYCTSPHWISREVHERVLLALTKLNRTAEAIDLLRQWETSDPSSLFRQKWCMRSGDISRASGDRNAALAAYRRVFTAHCQDPVCDFWYSAQTGITDLLTETGDTKGALQSAHLLLDAAPDPNALNSAVHRIADMMQKADGKGTRSKSVLTYQRTGTGEDPIAAIGYPDDPERTAAFAAASAKLGDDALAEYQRGQMCLYAGEGRKSIGFFIRATQQASWEDYPTCANALLFNGLRVAHGNAVGVDAAANYLLNGPTQGAADPFQAFIVPSPPATMPWQSPSLAPADVEAIGKLRASIRSVASDDSMPPFVRAAALRALARTGERANSAEDLQLASSLAGYTDNTLRDAAVSLAFTAARGAELHVGNIRAMLASSKLPPVVEKKAERDFEAGLKSLQKLTKAQGVLPR